MISLDEEYTPEEVEDGEISIVFWSFAFVFLLIVTVWFYITQIAPIRRSTGRQVIEEIDQEEVVAKRILEHLSEDLQFKSDISKENSLENAACASSTTGEDTSVYEYIDDEIHIHYSKYGWDDENDEASDYSSGLAAGRRHSMENMDLIFPGFLPSIVEEEEIDDETDTESSERSQDTDLDSFQEDFRNLPTLHIEGLVNKNGGFSEISMDIEFDYSKMGTKIVTSLESQESATKDSHPSEDRVVICEPAERYSLYAFESVDNEANVNTVPEPVKTDLNDTSLVSRKSDNCSQVLDTEYRKNIPSAEPALHGATQESTKPTKCQEVADFTSGNFDICPGKDDKKTKQDYILQLNDDVIEGTSMFTVSNCDLTPALKQDANEIEEPKLCALIEQQVSCPVENGLEDDYTRDIRSKHSKNDLNAHDKIGKDLYSGLSNAPTEDTSGLTGTVMNINKSDVGEFQMNGFVDEIADSNEHTTHSWTFFSMSGSDEITAPEKGISNHKQQSDQAEVPKIIIDSYDDGLQSDKLIPNEESIDMNGNETASRYVDSFESNTFETDIDIVDFLDSDELGEEGEFSIYFKRHVSVTDLDKIISEEGQADANGKSSEGVLETDLSVEEPPNFEEDGVGISTIVPTVISEDQETNSSHYATETAYSEDDSNMNIQKSIIITSTLSDCLDKQQSVKDLEEVDSSDSLHKSYAVETLMDDISFQKDGVYGELVLSKLNDSHDDQPDDVHFDSYGEDWSVFAEEYRRVRKPFLFTIPEDEEIGLAEVNPVRESYPWAQPRKHNYSYDNEPSAAKDTELKAPIATIDASDSEYDLDLDEDHSSSETEKSNEEIVEVTVAKDQQTRPHDFIIHNGVTDNGEIGSEKDVISDEEKGFEEPDLSDEIITKNGVIENGDVKGVLSFVNDEEKSFNGPVIVSDKIFPPHDGVTENRDMGGVSNTAPVEEKKAKEPEKPESAIDTGVTTNGGNNVTVDNSRSVKIVKKIKIFVRKEVKVTKDDQDLPLSPKQLIEGSNKVVDREQEKVEKKDTYNETLKKEVKEEEIILECRTAKTHTPYNFTTTQIGPVCHFMQPLNYEDGQCGVSQVGVKKMETVNKREFYTPPKPEPKVIEERVSNVEAGVPDRDITQHVTQPPAKSDQTKVISKAEPKIVDEAIEARVSTVEANAPDQDVTQRETQPSAQSELKEIDTKLESKLVTDIIKTRVLVEEESVTESHVTRKSAKSPIQNGEMKIDTNVESVIVPVLVEEKASSAKIAFPERDITKHPEQSPAQNDQMQIKANLEPKSVTKTVESRTSSVEARFSNRDIKESLLQSTEPNDETKINAKPETEIMAKSNVAHGPSVNREVPKSDITQNFAKLPSQTDQAIGIPKTESKIEPETVKAQESPVEANALENDITKHLTKPLVPNDQTNFDDKSDLKLLTESLKTRPPSMEVDFPKRNITYRVTKLREQRDGAKVNTATQSKVAPEVVKVSVSPVPVEADVPKRDVTQYVEKQTTKNDVRKLDDKWESKITPKTVNDSVSFVEAGQDIAQLPSPTGHTKVDSLENETKPDTKDEVQGKPSRANVGLKLFISGKRNKEDLITVKENDIKPLVSEEDSLAQPQESPAVKISVQGKDATDDRESRKVRSPRTSPTKALEKKPRKTYLASRSIRLTKSHEDLRFVEKAPEGLQDSIQEEGPSEEVPEVQSSPSIASPADSVFGDDAIESMEPPSIHTAKITVQEVVGDKQRILILNVRKKVQGKARWKSLNDLDSLNRALTPIRRSSDLGNGLMSFKEEDEKVEEQDGPKVVPVVQVKTRHDRKSLPEMSENRSEQQALSPRRSPILKVTALQDRDTVPEADTPTRIKARVMPVLREGDAENGETTEKIKEKETAKQEVKAHVKKISPRDAEARVESELVTEVDGKDKKTQDRTVRVSRVSPVVEAIPRLQRETVTEISEPATKGNKIKVHVARVTPLEDVRPEVENMVARPHLPSKMEAVPKKEDRETESRTSQVSPIVEVRYRQGRESGYGSLEIKDKELASPNLSSIPGNALPKPVVSALEGANERSVSSISSLEEEYYGETLGESRVMVTDLDALLAQQVAPQTEESPPPPSPEKKEVAEKVQVMARMGPVPEKVIRINSYEEDDGIVIRQVIPEDPVVLEPVILAEAADNEESAVISAFPMNDGYEDDELDEVFLEEYPPCIDLNNIDNSSRTHSSDADSETSSVSSLPLKHRHRQTRAALEAANIGVRNRNDSSGSSKTATPVAELENEKRHTSSGSTTPEMKPNEISRDESFSYKTPEHSRPAKIEKPTEFTAAFVSISRTTEIRRPRARSEHSRHKSDEEPGVESKQQGPGLQRKGLGASFQDVQTLPGLDIDKQRFKEAADSRKSMPDLTKKGHQINESPYLRGLSAHTRKWLSQNVWMDDSGQQDEEDLMTSDLFLYPSSRFQPGANIDASFMSLANDREKDFPDDISVNSSTLSTRPQSPMSEFSFAGETPYTGLRRGSMTVIKCSNPRCEREEVLFAGEKTTYTSCPACFTYYCTRICRRIHWSEHKKVCFFGRINSYIRSFIYICHKKEALKFQLSKAAKEGFKRKGRGCVLVTFASAQSARKFMTTGCSFFPSPPTYSSLMDLQAEGVVSKHRVALTQHIKDYAPEEEFVLNLAIIAGKTENLPANPVPRRKVNTVLQVVKIPLSSKLKEETVPSPPSEPNTETKVFYLPKCARHEFVNENEARRHYCRNISKNLKQYGIRLKNDYPDVYEKLCLYVDQNIRFTEPLTVYGNQGKKIVMCKIMPEAGDEVTQN